MRTARTAPPAVSRPVTRPGSPVSSVAPCRTASPASWLTSGSVSRYPSPGNQATSATDAGSRSDGSSPAASAAPIRRAGYPDPASLLTRAASRARPGSSSAHSMFPVGRYQGAPPRAADSAAHARIPAWLRSW